MKDNLINKTIHFLSGKEENTDTPESPEKETLPGFFDFIRKKWISSPDEKSSIWGFFGKFNRIYGDFQIEKEKETEKYNIYENITEGARFNKVFER